MTSTGRSFGAILAAAIVCGLAIGRLADSKPNGPAKGCSSEPLENEHFYIKCAKSSFVLHFQITCKTDEPNPWPKLPADSFDLPDVYQITISRCSFPEGLSLLNVTSSLGVMTNYVLEIEQARTSLRKEHLSGFALLNLRLKSSPFEADLLAGLETSELYIQKMSRTSLQPGFFRAAKHPDKLKYLTIMLSGLERVKRDDFAALADLRNLSLFNNAIADIEAGSFDRLANLSVLDLSKNNLRGLPSGVFRKLGRLERLHLSANDFDELPGDLLRTEAGSSLQRVRLNKNRGNMRALPSGFFHNLSSLNYVELTSNDFASIPTDVFLGARSLAVLNVSDNGLTGLPDRLFDTTSLQLIKMTKNRLMSLPDALFDRIHLKELYLDHNHLTNLTLKIASGLRALKILSLSYNSLNYIESNICQELTNVQYVNLSHNQLDLVNREYITNHSVLLNCIRIITMDLSYNKITQFFDDWTLDASLKELHLEGNEITHVTVHDLGKLQPEAKLDLRNNKISTIDLEGLGEMARNFSKLNPDVKKEAQVILENNPLQCDCRLLDFFRYHEGKMGSEVRDFVNIIANDMVCAGPSDLEGTPIDNIKSENLRCLIDANETSSNDACSRDCTCWRIPGRKVLAVDCSYRNLTAVPSMVENPYNWSIELNMTGNHLRSTPRMNVSYLANVTAFDLSFNNVSLLTIDVFTDSLRVLKLHNNSISQIDYYVVKHLYDDDLLTNLTLYGNPFSCGCETRNLLNFVQRKLALFQLHDVTCHGSNRRLYEVTSNELCEGMIMFIIFVAFFCAGCIAFIGIFAAFYFKYKIKIKMWLYSKQWCLWFVTEEELDKDKIYDAFISYSHKDADFVETEIVAKLEEGPMPYKLCLHYRDWLAGEWIPAQITRSVEESRRTIIILSRNFLGSEWGKMEFRAAHNQALSEGRARVIVVIYGEIGKIEDLDPELKAYLSMNTYVKWGDPWFWDKLRYNLPHRYDFPKKRRSRNARIIENHLSQLPVNNHHHNNDKAEVIPMPKITAPSDSMKLLESSADDEMRHLGVC